ncbi:conserved exported hypothetical protein [Luteimonas sp. 9C]|uniref:hypothetical protein n=1 Tax=Luteimonas sp. 9C TaxID=2653148 RepID=UPI0012F292CF|nr:hypothetical protein [Luteimonas sp. 9C]VXB96040.1 conserved exported hypothetical protein [Luteimonas sp. 9C]
MKMRSMWGALLLCAAALAAGHVAAQEMSFRSGLITGISPMQVPASAQPQTKPSQTGGAFGRALGRMAGRAASRVTGEYSYEAYEVASGATRDMVEGATAAPAAGAQMVTAYMVMIRFDDGSESAIRAASANGLQVGARARVFGTGQSAQIVME